MLNVLVMVFKINIVSVLGAWMASVVIVKPLKMI